jgi:ribosomal protein L37AE/L43A
LSLAELEAFDPQGKGRGREKIYRCPVCQSDERALHVHQETGLWNCKRASCGARGKLTDFWQSREQKRPQLNRSQRTRNALRSAFALEPAPEPPPDAIAPQKATEREITVSGEVVSGVVQDWREYLAASVPIEATAAAQYLAGRGVPGEVLAATPDCRHLDNFMARRAAAIFVFGNRQGEPTGFQARYTDEQANGHRALGKRGAGVFCAVPGVLSLPQIAIVEAPIDALSLAACGVPAIALGGCNAPDWLPPALGFRRVLLAFDNDANSAGDKAAAALAPALESYGTRVARLLPYRAPNEPKSDWNAMLQTHGVQLVQCHLRDELRAIDTCDGSDWLALSGLTSAPAMPVCDRTRFVTE